MRWLFWASDKPNSPAIAQADSESPAQNPPTSTPPSPPLTWSSTLSNGFTTPQTITACLLTTSITLILLRTYNTHLRRFPTISTLPATHLRTRSLYGYVHSVGDGDNFRLFHTPGGRLALWGILPSRRVHLQEKRLPEQTLHIRIAGIDAPECAHFGRPAQPYSQEALEWLRGYLQGRYVRVFPWRRDQYERVVCTVYTWRYGMWKRDVGEEMLKAGFATVYEAKFGSEFGDKEEAYRAAEERAKKRGVGMWASPGLVGRMLGRKGREAVESPRAYKTWMKKEDLAK